MVLNSPWLDMQGGPTVRGIGTTVIKQIGARQPSEVVPRTVGGHYGRSLHVEHDGEWMFNTDWKPLDSFPVTFGWLRAIRLGHDELQSGLEVGCPALVLSSAGTRWPKEMGEDAHGYDIVLEVPQIRQWATAVGSRVTYVAIEGARHDVVLSRPEPRATAYAELGPLAHRLRRLSNPGRHTAVRPLPPCRTTVLAATRTPRRRTAPA